MPGGAGAIKPLVMSEHSAAAAGSEPRQLLLSAAQAGPTPGAPLP